MKDYKKYFENKKITVMGLGILGRGLGYTKFLAECGADLIVTDLKTKKQLANSLKQLKKYKNIKYTLGEHKLEDFRNRDIVMKMAGVPKDSIYLKEAKKTGAKIEMDVSLFIKCAPKIKVIGVTGTRGKSMTTQLIYEILKENNEYICPSTTLRIKKPQVFLGGNVRGVATLPLLKEVKEGDILVCELDSWQLQGFGDFKMSPNISVFTSFMPDHMNYYKNSMKDYFADKANIFKYQKKGDVLITNKDIKKKIKSKINSQVILVDPRQGGASKKNVQNWKFIVPGEHQKQNLAYAVAVAKKLGIPDEKIKKTVASFKGVEGRLQLLRKYKGVEIYNDNNATTPEAVIAGMKAVKRGKRKLVLICGGADKKVDLTELVKNINANCKFVSLIAGTGTDVLLSKHKLKIPFEVNSNFKNVIKKALEKTKKGDVLLFSPAFASFGMFQNEYERNDLFIKIIKGLK